MAKYEFRSANGRICCSSDDPQLLCRNCKAKLAAKGTHRAAELRTTAAKPCADKDHETACPFNTKNYDPRGTPPNPYSEALSKAPMPLDPRGDPGYHSHGEPPDGYELARRAQKENAK
jgi:hypothetical protein